MPFVRETVRVYVGPTDKKARGNAKIAAARLEYFGWTIRQIRRVEVPNDKRQRHVWEVRAVKGWSLVIRLLDAWEAFNKVMKGAA